MALLARFPVAAGDTVPMTVNVTALPAPALMFIVAERLFPTRVGPLDTFAVPEVVGAPTDSPVMLAGIASASVAPVTLLGPVGFVTTIVYVIGLPAVYVALPSVLVTTRALC